jgi:hypothetical protein
MKSDLLPTFKSARLNSKLRFHFLILAAAIFHFAVASMMFLIGKLGLVPSQIDSNGLGSFAPDSYVYQPELMQLRDVLKSQGVWAWATWPTQLHVRIYSLPIVVLYRWTSFNILAIEPVNLIYYVAILALVLKLGETVFDYRVGLLAATIVGLWPSFLLHTTQLLRDPLLIVAFLLLMLGLIGCLKNNYSWRRGVLWGLLVAIAIVVIRIVRLPMWDLLWVIIGLAVCMVVIRFIQNRSAPVGKAAFVGLVIATMLVTPHFQAAFRNQQKVKVRRVLLPEELQQLSVPEQIARRREGFNLQVDKDGGVVPSDAGSDLNEGTHFTRMTDIVRYLPRAAAIGFLAPFPNMWFRQGKQVGFTGRMLSGIESILTYVIEGLALFGLWSRRRQLAPWLLSLSAAAGIVVLGLIVSNVGALYRLRYPFWILIVIVAAAGAFHLIAILNRRRNLQQSRPSS